MAAIMERRRRLYSNPYSNADELQRKNWHAATRKRTFQARHEQERIPMNNSAWAPLRPFCFYSLPFEASTRGIATLTNPLCWLKKIAPEARPQSCWFWSDVIVLSKQNATTRADEWKPAWSKSIQVSKKWGWTEYDSKTDSETHDWKRERVNDSEHYSRFLSTKRISVNIREQGVSNPSPGTYKPLTCHKIPTVASFWIDFWER